jgi:hypothetical protein
MKLFKVHYFDHVINRGKIQDIYARNVEQAADKWQNMRLNSQSPLLITASLNDDETISFGR